ncbi:MAG: class I SAM-dependent methyltransferase [Fibrobacterota bacterium]
MAHKFDPKEMEKLDNPERRKTLPPLEILRSIGLRPDHTFLDVGAGTGYFSLEAARIIGPHGHVLALDSSPDMLQELNRRIVATGINNIDALLCSEDGPSKPQPVADVALIAFVLHEVKDPKAFLSNIRKMLKARSRLAVIEWKKEPTEKGPPGYDRLAIKDVESFLSDSGYVLIESRPLNASHYIVIAENIL